MIIETLSTFPDMYTSVMGTSMMRIAQDKGILQFHAHDLRDWTHDRHRTTDDDPYGGGDGLVMKCEPIFEAYESIVSGTAANRSHVEPQQSAGGEGGGARCEIPHEPNSPAGCSCEPRTDRAASSAAFAPVPRPHTIFLSPHGQPFDDALATELAGEERLLFICGHYEGIDERAYTLADRTISLGDYVLTSGELASMVIIDAVVRKLPGVLGAETGAQGESFVEGLLEYPQYTRPATFQGMEVPPVLLSGNHAAIAQWRRQQSLERTARLRPDLLNSAPLSASDREFLQSLSNDTDA